ncbi:hypothetical protein NBRC116188_07900 [Oceaniserpentilla sp. 4NH20-0058]|uniref:2'-5' RNA ligase family protein n=1 Tax=Oceaniserpentilla sp. 4NH20-0058 TaxID=3127660 RepID=UPI003101E9DC
MRVFIALSGPDLISKKLNLQVLLSQLPHAHDPCDRHLTLAFLGELSALEVDGLITQLQGVYESGLLTKITWEACEIGDFPAQSPKAWALQGASTQKLDELVLRLEQEGVSKAVMDTSFIPHVSLAYLDGPSNLRADFPLTVSFYRLGLYRSYTVAERALMAASGLWAKPRYQCIHSWDLEYGGN